MNRMAGCQMEVTAKLCSAASRAWLPGSPAAWIKPGTGWNWMELDGTGWNWMGAWSLRASWVKLGASGLACFNQKLLIDLLQTSKILQDFPGHWPQTASDKAWARWV